VFESENLFKNLTHGTSDVKLVSNNLDEEDNLDSLDREIDLDELQKAK